MTVYHGEEKWDVKILEVYNVLTERRPFHNEMVVEGKAQVTIEEEPPMIFDFVYRGAPKENKKQILNYIRAKALDRWLESKKEKANTLQSYVEELVKEGLMKK